MCILLLVLHWFQPPGSVSTQYMLATSAAGRIRPGKESAMRHPNVLDTHAHHAAKPSRGIHLHVPSINPHPSFVACSLTDGLANHCQEALPQKSRQPRRDRPSHSTPLVSFWWEAAADFVPARSNWQLLAQFRRNDGLALKAVQCARLDIYRQALPPTPILSFTSWPFSRHRVSWSRPRLTSKLRVDCLSHGYRQHLRDCRRVRRRRRALRL